MEPFFIVASARSGTTFLRLTLNAHPEIAVPPESRFVTELWEGHDEVEAHSFLARLADHKRFRAWELSIDEVAAQIGDRKTLAYADAIACAYKAYAQKEGKAFWGDKTPRYVEHIPFLVKLFPTARFIHLVRDGRNVALSYSHVDFGPSTVAKAARLWGRRVAAGIRDGRALPEGRYIEVRQEELAADPQTQVRAVCDFVGVSFDERMFEDERRQHGVVAKDKHNYDPQAAGRKKMSSWQDEMAPGDVAVFEAVAGDVLSGLGYERRFPQPGLGARIKATLALAGLPIGRLKE